MFRSRGFLRLALAAWFILFLYATTWPWSDFQGHAHWRGVNLRPFAGATDALSDMALNVLLFVPFGYLSVKQSSRSFPAAAARAVVFAFALSTSIECLQIFMHNHFPTMTDVATDVMGTLGGAFVGRKSRSKFQT